MAFGSRRQSGWLAVLPAGSELVIAHVERRPGAKPKVTLLERFAIEGNERTSLQRLRSSRQLARYACTTLMSDGEYAVTQLDAPAVPEEERKEAVRWSLRDLVNFPVETACIDLLDIPGDGLPSVRQPAVLVVAADERAVRARAAPFEAAKVPLQAIDIPELAQRNIAALLEDENRGLAFLRVDERGMMLTLTFRGELIAIRRGEMNTHQLNAEDRDAAARVRERLVLEVQRSLDNFDRQHSHIPVSKVIVACSPDVDGLVAELGESTYLPVRAMDLAAVLDFPSIPELKHPAMQARNLLAIGAALRDGEVAA